MTTKARRKKEIAKKQSYDHDDNIINLNEHDYSELKNKLKITPKFPYRFTKNQKTFIDLALSPDVKVMFVSGMAGTSKTILATYCGLKLMQEQNAESITYVRSIVESSDRSLGFLPGDLVEKISPYMKPLEEKLIELIPPNQIKELQHQGRVDAMPVNFLRGLDFRPIEDPTSIKVLILDEFQNCTSAEIKTALTRVGEGCKVFICGDPEQSDIKHSGFQKAFNLFANDQESMDHGIYTFKFGIEDVVRSKLVKFILSKM